MSYTYVIVHTPSGDKCIRAVNDGIVLLIPEDPANTDYQRYLAWLAEGNEPEIVQS